MKKILILILKVLLGLIFPILLYIAFIPTEIGILYYFIPLPYLIFWILPIIFFEKIKYLILKLISLNFLILILCIYLFGLYGDYLYTPIINLNKDENLNFFKEVIINKINNIDGKYTFSNIEEFINQYPSLKGEKYVLNCYYLSSIENGDGFIIAYKYKSEENVQKNGGEYFIYKSIDNYIINDELNEQILEKLNFKGCYE